MNQRKKAGASINFFAGPSALEISFVLGWAFLIGKEMREGGGEGGWGCVNWREESVRDAIYPPSPPASSIPATPRAPLNCKFSCLKAHSHHNI